jgi:hypothetical protein
MGLPPDTVRVKDNYDASGSRSTYQVVKGGHIRSAIGTAFVEDGGTVIKCSQTVVGFVAKGGTLTFLQNPAGIVFFERGAVLGQEMTGPLVKNSYAARTLIDVREIVPSLGIPEFVFQALPVAADKPKSPPAIKSFTPAYGYTGDTVTLNGKGFQGTTEVYFAQDGGHRASFRVESDRVLKVEIPNGGPSGINFYQFIIVINPLGATVTVPPPNLKNVFQSDRGNLSFQFVHSGEKESGSGIRCFVEKGGLVESKTNVAFVKSGGRVIEVPEFMLYEAGAIIPSALDVQKKHHHEVPHLEASHVPALFYKMTMHDLLEDGVFPRRSVAKPAAQKKGPRRP